MAILCGGLGTRIAPVAAGLPKSLLPVGGVPFIDRQLALARRRGVRRVVLCVGVGADRIEAHVGDGRHHGLEVAYAREDPARLMGTGGAILNALPLLPEVFFVLYGDSYLTADYGLVYRAFLESGYPALMTVYHNQGRWDASNVRIAGGRVVFYTKRAAPGEAEWIDYGLQILKRQALDRWLDAPRPLDLSEILGALACEGRLAAWESPERFYEIGRPESYAELDRLLAGHPS